MTENNEHSSPYPLLSSLSLPKGVKDLCLEDLESLASELRSKLMEIKDKCGGHLASNLGVVELTIALHAIFESPKDKFIWDVSHQCYSHKMLTGRLDRIFTLKKYKGLSGFAKIAESEHDIFGAGHASTSISAGLGLAHSREMQNQDHNVISIFGDAALSGGMAYEAINNVSQLKGNFICILNDNDMSISPPVGSMANYITSLRTSGVYNKMKSKFESIMNRIPKIGEPLHRRLEKMVERMRNTILDTKAGVFFEEFGFRYLGPIDGHNISMVMAALKYAKTYPGPIMLHLITKKGKGYEAAEADPVKYHGVSAKKTSAATETESKKEAKEGTKEESKEDLKKELAKKPAETVKKLSYTQVFGEEIVAIGKENEKVTVITPAMREGSGLNAFEDAFPDRYYDVGIAEEHAVTFAAGLAKGGSIPVLAIYSTFLQRGFDQVIHDVCIQKLPVIFALDRAGIVGADGPTHHGVFDYSYLLLIPNMTILAPKDGTELRQMLRWSVDSNRIVSIRYPRGGVPDDNTALDAPLEPFKAQVLLDTLEDSIPQNKTDYDAVLIAAGSMVLPAYEIAKDLEKEGKTVAMINLRFIKPMDFETLVSYIENADQVFVLEEGNLIGGIHAYILQELSQRQTGSLKNIHGIGIPDLFLEHGSVDELKADHGLSHEQIKTRIASRLSVTIP